MYKGKSCRPIKKPLATPSKIKICILLHANLFSSIVRYLCKTQIHFLFFTVIPRYQFNWRAIFQHDQVDITKFFEDSFTLFPRRIYDLPVSRKNQTNCLIFWLDLEIELKTRKLQDFVIRANQALVQLQS